MNQHEIIWEELRDGSREALSQLFKMFYSRLFDYGTKIVNDKEIVKESIQEVFVNLWTYRDSLKAVNSVTAYLMSSVKRTIIRKAKEVRRNGEKRRIIFDHAFREALNIEQTIILFEVNEEKKDLLKQAIQDLTPRQKEAIYLKYYEGLNTDEIAKIMDINLQSIYNLIREAIKDLKGFICAQGRVTS